MRGRVSHGFGRPHLRSRRAFAEPLAATARSCPRSRRRPLELLSAHGPRRDGFGTQSGQRRRSQAPGEDPRQQVQAQKPVNLELIRTTTGISGSSEEVRINNKNYVIQHSIGQASVTGTFSDQNYVLRQGFIQPNILAKIIDNNNVSLALEAIVYPNPFIDNVTIQFNEFISDTINVELYDILGGKVISEKYVANKEIILNLSVLVRSEYILKVKAKNKLFVTKLLKNGF